MIELWEVVSLLLLGILCGFAMKDFCISALRLLFKQLNK